MKFSLRVKSWVLFASVIPVLLALFVSAYSATQSLDQLNQERLIALRDTKQARLENLLDRYKNNMGAIAEVITFNLRNFGSPEFDTLMRDLNANLEFYDVFVVNQQGDVVYTAAKEADYRTNLVNGPYAASGLGNLFSQVRQGNSFASVDFAPYAPSNNEPAAFIGKPISVEGERWMVATQLSIEGINSLMNLRSGMGESGETYLVGSDMRMRSDSFLDPANHSIKASFAGSVEKNGVSSLSVKRALSGETDLNIVNDYNGNPVISAFAPVDAYGHRWAIMAELDKAEAEMPIWSLLKLNSVVLILSIIGGLGAAVLVTRAVMRPLGGEPDEMKALMSQVASGDLRIDLACDDARSVRGALCLMAQELTTIIREISDSASQLAATSEELSVVTEQSEKNLLNQNQELEQAVTAVNEMSASIHEVAESASKAYHSSSMANDACQHEIARVRSTVTIVNQLVDQVDSGNSNVTQLADQVKEINTLLDVIRGVAEQTNLLALNAAIEAARAGESGRGFAVVADEVRNLAQRTQLSTEQIEEMVKNVNAQAGQTVEIIDSCKQVAEQTMSQVRETGVTIEKIVAAVSEIYDQAASVGSATEEQATVSSDIDKSLVTINDIANQNVSGAHETSASSAELARVAMNLKGIVETFKV